MKTTKQMTKAELAAMIEDQAGRIANLRETVETLNRMLLERAKAEGRAEGFTAAVVEILGGEKALYRALAMALHPDRGGDVAKMQAVNAAWSRAN